MRVVVAAAAAGLKLATAGQRATAARPSLGASHAFRYVLEIPDRSGVPQKERLAGPEGLVHRLTCNYGETMVDGVEAYFERQYDLFESDMAALMDNGFPDIAADFQEARVSCSETCR